MAVRIDELGPVDWLVEGGVPRRHASAVRGEASRGKRAAVGRMNRRIDMTMPEATNATTVPLRWDEVFFTNCPIVSV